MGIEKYIWFEVVYIIGENMNQKVLEARVEKFVNMNASEIEKGKLISLLNIIDVSTRELKSICSLHDIISEKLIDYVFTGDE